MLCRLTKLGGNERMKWLSVFAPLFTLVCDKWSVLGLAKRYLHTYQVVLL